MLRAPGMTIARLPPGGGPGLVAAHALLCSELGDLFQLAPLVEATRTGAAAVMVARQGGRLVAAAVARRLAPADADYYAAFGPAAQRLFEGRRPGSLEALAVAPRWRRRGLGRGLVEARVAWLRDAGCDTVVAVSWVSGSPDSSADLYRRLGLTEGPRVDGFYLDESRRDGWSCPACGHPCRCPAILFWLRLRRSGPAARARPPAGRAPGTAS